jgi:hypothetical protein
MLMNLLAYERDTLLTKFKVIFTKFLLLRYQVCLLVTDRELWWMNQKLSNSDGGNNRLVMVEVLGTPYATPPGNSS